MREKYGFELRLIRITVALILLAALITYLDPSIEGKYAGIAVSIITAVVGMYYAKRDNNVENLQEKSTIDLYKAQSSWVVPPVASFIILISTLFLLFNLFSLGFQNAIAFLRISEPASTTLTLIDAGNLLFCSILPLSAVWSTKIGFRLKPVSWIQVLSADIFTLGCISLLTLFHGIVTGLPPITAILGSLFAGNNAPSLPIHGRGLMIFLTIATSLFVTLSMTTWLWAWSRFGHWRFRRCYIVKP